MLQEKMKGELQYECRGIDVSKGKSVVTILGSSGDVILSPTEIKHNSQDFEKLIQEIGSLKEETKVVMEHTGKYYEPVVYEMVRAGIFVSVVNPKLIKDFGNNTLRKVKTDKADCRKIAKYGLAYFQELLRYGEDDEIRNSLKTMNRQFGFYTKQKTAMKNNLIGLLDETYPGINALFNGHVREDGSQKWVDFVYRYWHADCVRKKSENGFVEDYKKWCRKNKYIFSELKARKVYEYSKELIRVFPKSPETKEIIHEAVEQLNSTSKTVEKIRTKMNETAMSLPEYPAVIGMEGIGMSLGPQIMAEIGDVRRFHKKSALSAYAGVDPGANQSGTYQ